MFWKKLGRVSGKAGIVCLRWVGQRERERKKKECGANVRSLVRGTQSQNQKTRSGVGMGGYTRNGLSDHFLVLCGWYQVEDNLTCTLVLVTYVLDQCCTARVFLGYAMRELSEEVGVVLTASTTWSITAEPLVLIAKQQTAFPSSNRSQGHHNRSHCWKIRSE